MKKHYKFLWRLNQPIDSFSIKLYKSKFRTNSFSGEFGGFGGYGVFFEYFGVGVKIYLRNNKFRQFSGNRYILHSCFCGKLNKIKFRGCICDKCNSKIKVRDSFIQDFFVLYWKIKDKIKNIPLLYNSLDRQ